MLFGCRGMLPNTVFYSGRHFTLAPSLRPFLHNGAGIIFKRPCHIESLPVYRTAQTENTACARSSVIPT